MLSNKWLVKYLHVRKMGTGQNIPGQNIACHFLPPWTKHPTKICHPGQNVPCCFVTRTKHPMPFLPPRTKHPMPFLTPGQNIPLSGIFSGINTLDKSSYFLDKSGQGSCFYNIFMKYIYELMMIYSILSLTNRVVSH